MSIKNEVKAARKAALEHMDACERLIRENHKETSRALELRQRLVKAREEWSHVTMDIIGPDLTWGR